jgi:hypothetical protein
MIAHFGVFLHLWVIYLNFKWITPRVAHMPVIVVW